MNVLLKLNSFLWSGPLFCALLGTHLYFTIYFHFPQRHLLRGLRYAISKNGFSTLTTTLAATLGTGNIIGVGTAVALGGPGAVFWCWITGVLGMATTYAESYFSLLYKKNSTSGGTMYLLRDWLHHPGISYFYAFFVCLAAFFTGCGTQSNAIISTCQGLIPIPSFVLGLILCLFVGLVIFLGVSCIQKVCMTLVPLMSILFTLSCLFLIYSNRNLLVPSLALIIKSAFSPCSIGSGIVGFSVSRAMRYGIARGLFTNEAGLGTAGIVAAASPCSDLSGQSALSMCATFFDTVVLCGITGISVVTFLLTTGPSFPIKAPASLAIHAFSSIPFYGGQFLALEIFFFALATLIGWCFIGWQAASYLPLSHSDLWYRGLYLAMIIIGAIAPMECIWELTDLINACLAIPCLFALISLASCKK